MILTRNHFKGVLPMVLPPPLSMECTGGAVGALVDDKEGPGATPLEALLSSQILRSLLYGVASLSG